MEQRTIDLYKQQLNLKNADFERIQHEDAIVADVFKVKMPNGESFILKIAANTHDYLREVYFLKFFAEKICVPKIVELMPPQSGLKGAILMEYLPGILLTQNGITEPLAFEIGTQLATIHTETTIGYGDLTQPHELTSEAKAPFTAKFEEGMEECAGHLSHQYLQLCRQYYNDHVSLLTKADGPCIIHRDFRPGNLMIHQGKLRGIIDWASARASFAEEDFCSMEFKGWLKDPLIKQSFFHGYESIRPLPHYHEILPFLQLNKAIATIGFTVKRGTWNNIHAHLYQVHFQFLESFFKI